MKKLFSIMAAFVVVMFAAVMFTGCTKKADITYAISVSCSDYLYSNKLSEYFDIGQNGNTFTIKSKNKTGNEILAANFDNDKCLQLNIYLTNSSEKFYRASLSRVENNVSGLSNRMQDVVDSKITLKVNCPNAKALTGLNAVTINVAQGSTSGACSVDNKGKKVVSMEAIKIVLEVIPYSSIN